MFFIFFLRHQIKNSTKDDKSQENQINISSPEKMSEKKNNWLNDEINVENKGDNLSSSNIKAEDKKSNENDKPST